MKKIALLEKQESIKYCQYDKVISFCRDGHVNVDSYVDSVGQYVRISLTQDENKLKKVIERLNYRGNQA